MILFVLAFAATVILLMPLGFVIYASVMVELSPIPLNLEHPIHFCIGGVLVLADALRAVCAALDTPVPPIVQAEPAQSHA